MNASTIAASLKWNAVSVATYDLLNIHLYNNLGKVMWFCIVINFIYSYNFIFKKHFHVGCCAVIFSTGNKLCLIVYVCLLSCSSNIVGFINDNSYWLIIESLSFSSGTYSKIYFSIWLASALTSFSESLYARLPSSLLLSSISGCDGSYGLKTLSSSFFSSSRIQIG